MLSRLCSSLCIVLSGLLVLTPVMAAQQTNPAPRPPYSAPVPPQLLHAQRIFVANGGGSNYFDLYGGGPSRAYNIFYKDLKRTRHYELVGSPAQADLIFEIRAIAPASSYNDTPSYNPQVVLTIRDPHSTAVLWTESANVRGFGTRRQRDRQFNQAVAVLVDKLAVVTGQPLTPAQTRAVVDNSYGRMSTGEKIIIASSIAIFAGMLAYGIHRMNNPPKLPTLPPPTPPVLP